MISFLEVLQRATTGPMMSAKEYDMKVFIPAVREVVKKYKIEFDPSIRLEWNCTPKSEHIAPTQSG
ncbi:MAG: hypothetical protein ACYSTF_10345 [Planctomycetota bacterium]